TTPASQTPSTGNGSASTVRHADVTGVDGGDRSVAARRAAESAEAEPPRSYPGQHDIGLQQIELLGMCVACCSEPQLLDALFEALELQRGGWLITANLDFLRRYQDRK